MKRASLTVAILFSIVLCNPSFGQYELWGTLKNAGKDGFGSIYRYHSLTDSVYHEYDFPGIAGSFPYYSRLSEDDNGILYGVTESGGKWGYGIFYSFNPGTSEFNAITHFDGQNTGAMGCGGTFKSSSGKIWGVTANGGLQGGGSVFSYNPAAQNFQTKKGIGSFRGNYTMGNFIESSNGKFYAMCSEWNDNAIGFIYEYDAAIDSLTPLIRFDTVPGNRPLGDLIEITPGIFYGLTEWGGNHYHGVLFKYDMNNGTYQALHHFNDSIFEGEEPNGSLIYENGNLYGFTSRGGANYGGTFFRYSLSNQSFQVVKSLGKTGGPSSVHGTLAKHLNGKYYGLSTSRGLFENGTLFEWDPVSDSISIKMNFYGSYNGREPYGSLFLASNGKFYGATSSGGKGGGGTLFSYDPITGLSNVHVNFNYAELGKMPVGELVLHSNGKFYGSTQSGGNHGGGTIFEYDPLSKVFTPIFNGNYNGERAPYQLTEGPNGDIFWFGRIHGELITKVKSIKTSGGPLNYHYSLDNYSQGFIFSNKVGFTSSGTIIGANPDTLNRNGKIFEIDLSDSSYQIHHVFSNYSKIKYELNPLNSSKYLGVAAKGGGYDLGGVFEFDYPTKALNWIFDINDSIELISSGPIEVGGDLWAIGSVYQFSNVFKYRVFKYDQKEDSINYYHQQDSRIEGHLSNLKFEESSGQLIGLMGKTALIGGPQIFFMDTTTGTIIKNKPIGIDYNWQSNSFVITPVLLSKLEEFGIEAENELKAYPNPFNSTFKIQTNEISQVTILDVSGKVLLNFEYYPGDNIKIEGPTGLYILKVKNEMGIYSVKVIKR